MFAPSREQARRFFIDSWRRFRAGDAPAGLEQTALGVILMHPEHHSLLEAPERHLDRDYLPESGAFNPFLHLSLHLAVAEQLAIDQPAGIRAQYERLRLAWGSDHDALHALLDCLGEVLWQAQRLGNTPDEQVYLECLRRRS